METFAAWFALGVVIALAVLVVFLPAVIAFRRGHPNRWPILMLTATNAFLGVVIVWALPVLWLVVLAWSLSGAKGPDD